MTPNQNAEGQADADGMDAILRDQLHDRSRYLNPSHAPIAKPQPLAKADEVGEAVDRLTRFAEWFDDPENGDSAPMDAHSGLFTSTLRTILADHARLKAREVALMEELSVAHKAMRRQDGPTLGDLAKIEAVMARTLPQGDSHER
jgi:hypothetical protein